MTYNNYLQSTHWKNTRNEKLQNKPSCQVCGSIQQLHIHHKRYSHNGESILLRETNKSLVTLCASCHKLTHKYLGIEVHKLNKKYCRIRRLIDLGVRKAKAFWIVGKNDQLFNFVKNDIELSKGLYA